MKQGKIVNLNVKIRLYRKPSREEKRKLVESVANLLDSGGRGAHDDLYEIQFGDDNHPLFVEHHYVTERKMGRI